MHIELVVLRASVGAHFHDNRFQSCQVHLRRYNRLALIQQPIRTACPCRIVGPARCVVLVIDIRSRSRRTALNHLGKHGIVSHVLRYGRNFCGGHIKHSRLIVRITVDSQIGPSCEHIACGGATRRFSGQCSHALVLLYRIRTQFFAVDRPRYAIFHHRLSRLRINRRNLTTLTSRRH